ncbi:IclR family transcriptional regulator domain-containing protein [Georgenia alba]|uniref:IclR family transcriptional regulator C-terminal domain-containing protein n=1 Tax=Georgenia alba TaxID=2233858 RepID=A0ABW2QAH9_9MICO
MPSEGMAGLAKGLAIIEAFGPGRAQMSVTDAANLTGMWPATARRCLLTLVDLGYLAFDGKFYRPTPRMVRLGTAYLDTAPLPVLAQPHATAARDEIGESVSVAVLDGTDALFVVRVEVQRLVTAAVRLGTRLPAWASASGRVLLADLPEQQVRDLLADAELAATTPNTLVDLEDVLARIAQTREDGYGYTDEELELGIRTVSVPVRDAAGRTRAAMSTAVLAARVTETETHERILPLLHAHADRLGKQL